MISLDLLQKTGNIEALITLTNEDSTSSAGLAEVMDLHESTVRQRMNELGETDLVEATAEINDDGQPVRKWTTTDKGERLATTLASLIDEYQSGDRSKGDTPSETSGTSMSAEDTAEGDD